MNKTVLLCSTSPIKLDALTEYLANTFEDIFSIDMFNCDNLNLPNQPINTTLECCNKRLEYSKKINKKYDIYVSIENGIEEVNNIYYECCYVILEQKGVKAEGLSEIEMPHKFTSLIKDYKDTNITFGETLKNKYPELNIDPKNWIKTILNIDRKEMIQHALASAKTKLKSLRTKVKSLIRFYKEYPDFPKPGVIFQDIFSILENKDAFLTLCKIMKERYKFDKIDYIVGLESRGFFGVLLAKDLEIGFIPIRKKGKLPGQVEQISYGTEYSQDTCEISKNIPEGSKVIIFDDLIATGGSLMAAVTLLLKLKCEIVDCCVLREVLNLRETAIKTMNGQSYTVLLQE